MDPSLRASPSEEEQQMTEPDRYIAGVPCWVDTSQPDPPAAVEFYGGLFGWELTNSMPAGAPGAYYMARLNGGDVAAVGSVPGGAPPIAMWNTYVWVDSADATAERVRAAGGVVVAEPFDIFDSGRMAVFADTEGAVFGVWQPREHRGATVVNEHGSLNFNDLHTRDVEGAKAFYGAVFGWEALDVGAAEMWALPAYGDFLEERTPGNRARIGEMGAPAGFESVVASIAPIAADDAETPAHWGVTFAVADTDATAALAVELGGAVVVAPLDAPWVRMTVIRDPQGATFTASQFVPENAAGATSASATAGI
jgi:predicted enzyme related to lactoylglutathione lyase